MRAHFRAVRQRISSHDRDEAAKAAAALLISHPLFLQSERIACYLAYHHELETLPLIQYMWAMGKKCYLPRLTAEKSLVFAEYHQNDSLEPNQFGILEPTEQAKKINAAELDLVIMPLVAFDLAGHRIGTGGGYYDRTFAFMRENSRKKPILMGYGYSVQESQTLPVDQWDVELGAVGTEKKIMYLG